ncbi:MAG: trigger factor, partial [Leptospiraceae bacterium]|nr:trigger factor [Leptospiraceae bacterium]
TPVSRSSFSFANSMEFKTKKKSETVMEITVSNTAEEVERSFKRAYEKARPNVKLPGFRKGKVPLDMVARHLGESVAQDAANFLIQDSMEGIFPELEPAPIRAPQFEIENLSRTEGASFKGQYEYIPEIKPAKYRKLKGEKGEVKIEDTVIQKKIDLLRKEHAVMKTRETGSIEEEDYARLNLSVKDGDEVLFENDDFPFYTARDDVFPGLKENVIGSEIGTEKNYEQLIADDFPDQKFAGKKVTVSFTVKESSFRELPELNDEFAKDLGEFETLDDLKKDIEKNIREAAEDTVRSRVLQTLVDELTEKTKFDVPGSLVDSEFERRLENLRRRIGQKDMPLEQIAQLAGESKESLEKRMRDDSEKHVRESLILSEIADKEEIAVEEPEIDELIKERAGSRVPSDQVDMLVQNPSLRDDIRFEIRMRKTLDLIWDNADFKKGSPVSAEKLFEEGALQY